MLQDSSPAHTHPQQLEDSRQAGGAGKGTLPDLSQKPACEGMQRGIVQTSRFLTAAA